MLLFDLGNVTPLSQPQHRKRIPSPPTCQGGCGELKDRTGQVAPSPGRTWRHREIVFMEVIPGESFVCDFTLTQPRGPETKQLFPAAKKAPSSSLIYSFVKRILRGHRRIVGVTGIKAEAEIPGAPSHHLRREPESTGWEQQHHVEQPELTTCLALG